jgi:hypothetical protein
MNSNEDVTMSVACTSVAPQRFHLVPDRAYVDRLSSSNRGMVEGTKRRRREVHQDLVSRLMADMEPELLTFLRTAVNSFVKWDLIHFFYKNPHTADTVENIARYAGRTAGVVEAELAELAAQGILVENRLGEMTIYSLSSAQDVWDMIHRFIEASDDRQFRAKAIYHIIRAMR